MTFLCIVLILGTMKTKGMTAMVFAFRVYISVRMRKQALYKVEDIKS